MAISFNQVDPSNRNPGAYMEFDSTRALRGLQQIQRKALIIGQKTSAGTLADNTIALCTSGDQAKTLGGVGSMLADMYEYWEKNNKNIETHVIAVPNSGTAQVQRVSVSLAGTAGAGTIHSYIGGRKKSTSVSAGDSAGTIATNFASTVNDDTDLLFDASVVNVSLVDLTAKNGGLWTDSLKVIFNYRAENYGGTEKFPTNVTLSSAITVNGSGNPDITDAIAGIPDERYDFIIQPYTDDANMDLWDAEMTNRHDAMVQLEGHSFNAYGGTTSAVGTWGNDRNSQYNTTMDAGVNEYTPAHGWAGAYAGQASTSATQDVALPWQGLELIGVLPDHPEDERTFSERNTLMYDGIATHKISSSGAVLINRGCTNYQKNSFDQPDASWLDSQTALTASYCRITFNQWMLTKFPRHKLADDTAVFSAGQFIVTPKIAKAEAIAWFVELEEAGILENVAQFKSELIVERNGVDPNRLDFVLPTDFVNQMRIFASRLSFILN
jgi:phage tail sheath gpL-like